MLQLRIPASAIQSNNRSDQAHDPDRDLLYKLDWYERRAEMLRGAIAAAGALAASAGGYALLNHALQWNAQASRDGAVVIFITSSIWLYHQLSKLR